jgi:hypothetical protein
MTSSRVPQGNKPFLAGHGVGTRNYVRQPSGAGVALVLFTPEATLFRVAQERRKSGLTGRFPC